MAFKCADRIKETTTTEGTGAIQLAGAVVGFKAFSSYLVNNDTTYYSIEDTLGNWENGYGTFQSGTPDSIVRTNVVSSSNNNLIVNFGSGDKNIFCTNPADATGLYAIDGSETFYTQAIVFGNNSLLNYTQHGLSSLSGMATDGTIRLHQNQTIQWGSVAANQNWITRIGSIFDDGFRFHCGPQIYTFNASDNKIDFDDSYITSRAHVELLGPTSGLFIGDFRKNGIYNLDFPIQLTKENLGNSPPDGAYMQFFNEENNNQGSGLYFCKKRGNSFIVQDGDTLMYSAATGYDGTDYNTDAAYFGISVDGTPTAGSIPGKFYIGTTSPGDQYATTRFQIRSDGTAAFINGSKVQIGSDTLLALAARLEIDASQYTAMDVRGYNANFNYEAPEIALTKINGSKASPTPTLSGDSLAYFAVKGHDGTSDRGAAYLEVRQTAAIGAGNIQSQFRFWNGNGTNYTNSLDLSHTTADFKSTNITTTGEISGAHVNLKATTVAGLPAAASNTGDMYRVTDANAPSMGATVSGGGSANAMVWSNGTNWTVFGI